MLVNDIALDPAFLITGEFIHINLFTSAARPAELHKYYSYVVCERGRFDRIHTSRRNLLRTTTHPHSLDTNDKPSLAPAMRLIVGHNGITLAKRPSESANFHGLRNAIKALAREAARIDHSTQKDHK
ncbi:hypothetical protein BC777_2567 [Yoonia maricola]|uniref:Uncharacterized protein n=1 Tax=Yoonia maricola TaxID=420999 RepID=A0A2M8W5J5_9RHOB|nr:hypothetical protein [Yoonia maricola]PJI86201.1 hypothetical protein BC777_2567 [Yoonia maricola]